MKYPLKAFLMQGNMNPLDVIKFKLNVTLDVIQLIEHNDGLVDKVYKVCDSERKNHILKTFSRDDDFWREVFFLNFLSKKIPVPKIHQAVEPTLDSSGAILMEFLDGTLVNRKHLSDQLASSIGCTLGKIHLNKVEGFGELIKPESLNKDPRTFFRSKFEEGIKESIDHLPSHLIDRCCLRFEEQIDLLIDTDGPCVIHRDFRPGNIIVKGDVILGVIDWSSAKGGFAEEDFCPLEFEEWPKRIRRAFLEGYSTVRKIPDYHKVMHLLRLSRAIAAIGFTVKRDIWQTKGSKIYKFSREFIDRI